ncbi:MAG: hypothetical protein ACI9QV_000525 [Methylophagaceae bacterium]|jgi:hypothetical protein
MKKDAAFSPCRRYRYALWRHWDDSKPTVLFIGLNPSTADEENDDPTLIRCINFAKSWDNGRYGGVCIANLFAYRATKPKDLLARKRATGQDNDEWLLTLTNAADLVIASWGNDGHFQNRAEKVKKLIHPLHYLRLNKSGEPAHPLYLQAKLTPILFKDYVKVAD